VGKRTAQKILEKQHNVGGKKNQRVAGSGKRLALSPSSKILSRRKKGEKKRRSGKPANKTQLEEEKKEGKLRQSSADY